MGTGAGAGTVRVGKSAVIAGSIEVEGSGLGARELQARQRALHDGLAFGTCHRFEQQLAELVLEAFPYADRCRFVVSGGYVERPCYSKTLHHY